MSFRQPPRGAAKAVNCCEGNDEDCERLAVKIDEEACLTWEFPSNYPIRQYQVSIVKEALLKNTLVCLPTGLGKTLIAAVLMHNYFRWFPTGQIIFMAPTRPLVGQQIEACHKVVGIPETATAELSGSTASEDRRRLWRDRRVFYCTPQTVSNDLKTGVLDPRRVVLVVFDEAHRALKKYAYCEVLNLIAARQCHFRVLALSATPGSTADGAQAVIDNLRISNVEMRTEDDAEVAPHTHARLVEKVFCDETEASGGRALGDALAKLAEPCVSRLFKVGLLRTADCLELTAFSITCAQKQYAERKQAGVNYADFVLAQKLLAAHDSLKTFGQGGRSLAARRSECPISARRVAESDLFKETVEKMRGSKAEHPKTTALRELLVDHFARAHQAGASSRAMVFTGTRDSVDEIALALEGSPLLFVQKFVGQGGAEGMKQTVQRAAVAEFQRGSTNVMVATCIAEEGLDIAAVDICVFYDQVGSPIRLVQRMGRTARQRTGRVVMLMVRGEEKKLDSSRKKSASVAAFLCSDAASGNGIKLHANLSKRMIPRRLVSSPRTGANLCRRGV
ncbi:P-loop containing nucleoside triphosphate hydrolase protein [Pelagophyceae sp. CCMP2097]|nr:P-loop containing nucleoside triphosphate hydrolase protein [Pelagophyceae sp. CCMP2097]